MSNINYDKHEDGYRLASRIHHPENTVIEVGGVTFGDGSFRVIAGPCAVESLEGLAVISSAVAQSGADMLRGGAYKPRTSPYSFQGLHEEALSYLSAAKTATHLPTVTEITDKEQLSALVDVDMLQVGARNMQNFSLLTALGHQSKPVLLKRGPANTIEEWLMSAEYILAEGNSRVILCDRGIRTFEHATRNTLDLTAVQIVKKLSHLPVIVDPSHAAGHSELVSRIALSAIIMGADGVMVEVHDHRERALSDGEQALSPVEFDDMMHDICGLREYLAEAKKC